MTTRAERPHRPQLGVRHRLLVAAGALVTIPALIPGNAAQAASASGAGSGSQGASATRGEVRVDQVGYATTATKRAYLMTSTAHPGARFRVVDSHGDAVYSSTAGADQGSWGSTYNHVYALDFNRLYRSGSFHIVVSDGSMQVRPPAFRIDTPAKLYAMAMANSLSFYQNERDGPDFIPSALRTAPGHLNDEDAMTYSTPKTNNSGGFSGD